MDPEHAHEELAEGLWFRLRDIALVADRLESFTFAPDRQADDLSPGALGDLQAPDRRALVARDLVLRVFQVGLNEPNYRILLRLRGSDPVPLSELAALLGVSRIGLVERINDLMQVGLVSRVLETDSVQSARVADGLLALVDYVASRLEQKIDARYRLLRGGRGE